MSDNTAIAIVLVAICFSMAWCVPRLAAETPAAIAAKCEAKQ
jgi:hypothetical protein